MLEHYLSARVPPARLLSGAVRRVWRRARARVAPTPPRPADILAGMQAASAEALALQLASPGRALVAYDRVALTRALARHFPGEAERAIRRAEQALAGRVSIFGRQVDIARAGGGIHWQRDPFARSPLFDRTRDAFVLRIRLAGRACAQDEPAVAQTSGRAVDPRAVWAVGRGDHWVALGCAGVAAPEQAARYAEAFVESLRDFASENPLGVGLQWASPMEAALRLVCVGQAHALLAGQRALEDPRYALELAQLAVGTARLVAARLEDDGAVPNNHLVADHVGLLAAAALLPEWPEAPRWRAAGAAGLRREIMAQTHADGTSFEGSVPYHRLAVELFTAGALLARRARVRLGTPYGRRLAWMYSATRSLLFTGGELPQLGDHDSGRVLAFRERPALSAGYLLPLGAAVTGDPSLRLHSGAEDAEEALWTCGAAAVERLLAAEPGPRPGSATFPDGGFHVLRRGGAEVAISCGRNGQAGVGGHSHNDKLAFELRLGGELVVGDPGSPCYTSDAAARDAFRSTRAHATVVIDGAEQAPIPRGRPFALPDAARATCVALASSAEGERFTGEHQGYARLGVVHRREILLDDDGLLIVDRLLGAGEHEIELRWPFPDKQARLRPLAPDEARRVAGRRADPHAARFDLERAVEVGPAEAPRAVIVAAGPVPLTPRLEPAAYAPGYGELKPSRTAVFAGRVACPATLLTILLPLGPAARTEEQRRGASPRPTDLRRHARQERPRPAAHRRPARREPG